ncbi:hypothetical protein CYMTET_23648 [Cymbomonas tetramitiformis]|uniref:Pirin n=1 Tax=Cymbomonas tetramitiformis TaxID=36881 RepID=A0AAE0FY17_9CHLO|nr:hypothetical protein CYMTET_23648 [Cymbomonas tetramitiformis]|eukprot:gene1352-1953_t
MGTIASVSQGLKPGNGRRTIKEILRRPPQHWVGNGFHVYPVFANKAFTNELSPFLMFDYAKPKHFEPTSQRRGVGQHPHRGFETVSVAFQGEVEHSDSVGNRDVIGPGDVQWMTAGRGIIHEEFHSTEFAKRGGIFEFCQLWVNLPQKDKMHAPRYQPITAKDIPSARLLSEGGTESVDLGNGEVRVISGNFNGVKGAAQTFSQVEVWDVIIEKPNTLFSFPVIASNNIIVFVREGNVEVEGQTLSPQDVAITNTGGLLLNLKAVGDVGCKVLILGGEPLNEPIAARGPFVMNTQNELAQAMDDFHSGKLGK